MLMTQITVENRGGSGEDVIGNGFHEYFPGLQTTSFTIESPLAGDAVDTINAASPKLTATAGTETDIGDNGIKPNAADDDAVAEVQSPGEAGDLTLDGADVDAGVATFDVPRKVTLTSDSDTSGVTVTVTGTDENGDVASEELTGPDTATVTTTGWFSTVTGISVDAAATNLKAGKGAGLVTLDLENGEFQQLTVGADCTISLTNWLSSGLSMFRVLIDNTDDYDITWEDVDFVPGGSLPIGTPDPNVHIAKFVSPDAGVTIVGIIEAQDLAA